MPDDGNIELVQQSLHDFAAGLASDLSPIRDRIEQLAELENGDDLRDGIEELRGDLPGLLADSMASEDSKKALAASMGTLYHNGMVAVDDGMDDEDKAGATPLTGILPLGKIAGAILTAGLLTNKGDVNTDVEGINLRADWSAAATKAGLADSLSGDLQDASEYLSPDSITAKLATIADGLSAKGLAENGDVALNNDTQNQMAFGYGGQVVLDDNAADYPAAELYRQWDRKEWRNWPERWRAAGGQFFPGDEADYPEGRMIALMNDPIWLRISRFGTPYSPFDYNSGMEKGPISFDDTVELGLLNGDETELPEPIEPGLNDSVEFSADLDHELGSVLKDYLGKDFVEKDGRFTNNPEPQQPMKITNGGPGSGRKPGQDSDANAYARLVQRIREEGTPYRREVRGQPFHALFRGKRLGKFKLEGDQLTSKAFVQHGRDSATVIGV